MGARWYCKIRWVRRIAIFYWSACSALFCKAGDPRPPGAEGRTKSLRLKGTFLRLSAPAFAGGRLLSVTPSAPAERPRFTRGRSQRTGDSLHYLSIYLIGDKQIRRTHVKIRLALAAGRPACQTLEFVRKFQRETNPKVRMLEISRQTLFLLEKRLNIPIRRRGPGNQSLEIPATLRRDNLFSMESSHGKS